jgi:hypothetical protein
VLDIQVSQKGAFLKLGFFSTMHLSYGQRPVRKTFIQLTLSEIFSGINVFRTGLRMLINDEIPLKSV